MDPQVFNFFGVMLSLGIVGAGTYTVFVLVNGVANRFKGKSEPEIDPAELEYLRDRAEQVDGLAGRVAELETRLDFAERLLTESSKERHDTPAGSV